MNKGICALKLVKEIILHTHARTHTHAHARTFSQSIQQLLIAITVIYKPCIYFLSNTPVGKIRFVSKQQRFNSEIYWPHIWLTDWLFGNDKIRSIYKKDYSWTHQLLQPIYYCSVVICCPAVRWVFNCWNVFRISRSTAVAGTGATIDISIYLER